MKLVAGAVAVVLCAATPALAEGGGVPCRSVVDDQRGLVETTAGEAWRDLLWAGVGSDGRSVTVRLGLRDLPVTPSRPEHAAVDYTMRFTVRGATAFLTVPAHEQVTPTYGVEIGYRPVVLGEAAVARDRGRRELRVTAPISGFAPLADLRPGGIASNLAAHVTLTPGLPGAPAAARAQTVVVDGADSRKSYRLGSPGCVPRR